MVDAIWELAARALGWSFPRAPGWGRRWPQHAYDLATWSEFRVGLGDLFFGVVGFFFFWLFCGGIVLVVVFFLLVVFLFPITLSVSDSCSATYQSWQEAEPVTS